MKKFALFSCFFLILTHFAYTASIYLYNDSPFVLNATIMGADGSILSKTRIYPQHRHNWIDSYQGGATFSQTPYTVIWECMEGAEYGISTNAGPGAFISAQSSDGARYCRPKKKSSRSTREAPLNQPATPSQ